MEKVIIFEPNAYHYEILPGFAKYFLDLGYEVDLLVHAHEEMGNEMQLCNFDINILK